MDYELKRIIAISLIVKLVALSSEFSIRSQGERLNQGSEKLKSSQLMSLAAVKEPRATSVDEGNQGVHFNVEPGEKKAGDFRKFNKKYIAKSEQVRINSAFDICEHMAGLLESSKWRDIQKTLHWLNRVLASRSNKMRSCRRKSKKTKGKFFYSPKTNSKTNNYFELKKFSNTLLMNPRRNLINSLTPHNNSEQTEILKKECEGKYKFGKNKLKHLYQKNFRRRTKDGKYFGKKIFEKYEDSLSERPLKPNNSAIESNNAFSDCKKFYHTKEKEDNEHFGSEKMPNLKSNFENSVEIYKDLERKLEHLERGANQRVGKKKLLSNRWPVSLELKKSGGRNSKKKNPWPNFIYHRVSSDLLNLGSTGSNHKQSAYVAISVNTSGEPGKFLASAI